MKLLAHIFELLKERRRERHQNERKLVSALENLTQAVQDLTTAVDAAVTVINTPHISDAQAQAAADAVTAQAARLNTAVNPNQPAAPPA